MQIVQIHTIMQVIHYYAHYSKLCTNLFKVSNYITLCSFIYIYANFFNFVDITHIHPHLCKLCDVTLIMRLTHIYSTLGIVFTCTHNYASGADLGNLCKSACYTNYTFYPHFCNLYQLIPIDSN